MCSLLLAENMVVRAVNLFGQPTKATVIKREVADVEVNYKRTLSAYIKLYHHW